MTLLYRQGFFRQHLAADGHSDGDSAALGAGELPGAPRHSESSCRSKAGRSCLRPGSTASGRQAAPKCRSTCWTLTCRRTIPRTRRSPASSTAATSATACARKPCSASAASRCCARWATTQIETYHMNEGHSALLTLALLDEDQGRLVGRPTTVTSPRCAGVRLHDAHARARRPRPLPHGLVRRSWATRWPRLIAPAALPRRRRPQYDLPGAVLLPLRQRRGPLHGEVAQSALPGLQDRGDHQRRARAHLGVRRVRAALRPQDARLARRRLLSAPGA